MDGVGSRINKIDKIKTFEVKKENLGEKIGEIVPWGYKKKLGENVFMVYIDGKVPINIKCKYTKEEFNRMCGKYM